MRNISIVIWSLVVVLGVFVVGAPDAHAQQDPLRLSFVNVSKKGGGKAYKAINDLLKASDDIKTSSSKKFLGAIGDAGLDKGDLRSGKKRDRSAEEFRTAMKARNIEAVLLLDVYSKERKLQVVVIGPEGKEVADIRRNIKRGRLKKNEAKKILKEAFGELVPSVKAFRDNGGWDAVEVQEEEEEEEEIAEEEVDEEEEDEESDDLKDEVLKKKRSEDALKPGYDIRFGALLGSRSFSLTEPEPPAGQDAYLLDHKSPFVGIWVEIDAVFAVFGDGSSAFGGTLFGGYAPFTTVFQGANEFPSDYARAGAEIKYIKGFTPEVALSIYGGAEAMSVTIEQNEFYTGNRYITGRGGAEINYDSGRLFAGGGGGVLPVFDVNNSNGAFGDAPFTLGFEFMAHIGFRITEQINLELGYDFQTISTTYEEPKVRVNGRALEPLEATDSIHTGFFTVGYHL